VAEGRLVLKIRRLHFTPLTERLLIAQEVTHLLLRFENIITPTQQPYTGQITPQAPNILDNAAPLRQFRQPGFTDNPVELCGRAGKTYWHRLLFNPKLRWIKIPYFSLNLCPCHCQEMTTLAPPLPTLASEIGLSLPPNTLILHLFVALFAKTSQRFNHLQAIYTCLRPPDCHLQGTSTPFF
jgi:hypothetical protein